MNRIALPVLILFAFGFSGCSLFYSSFFDEPEVIGYKNIRISKIGFSGADLLVTVLVKNQNSIDANILRCDYELFVNDTYIGKGSSDLKQTLPARDTSEIEMPLNVKTSDLLP